MTTNNLSNLSDAIRQASERRREETNAQRAKFLEAVEIIAYNAVPIDPEYEHLSVDELYLALQHIAHTILEIRRHR